MDVKNTDFEKTKHNLCFLILEGVIMLPLLVMNFSWIHALAYLVLGGYLVNQLMFKEAYKGNPGALFSTMVLVDILLIGVLHMDYVWMQKGDFEQSLTLFMDSIVSSVSILAIAGILLAVFYKSKILKIRNVFLWAILTMCMVLRLQSQGSGIEGAYFIIFYGTVSAGWILAETLSRKCMKEDKVEVGKRTTFLFVLAYILVSMRFTPLLAYVSILPQSYAAFGEKYMSAFLVILMVALTGVMGYVLQPKSRKEQHTEGNSSTLFMWGFGGLCLVLKCSQTFYFTYVWALVLLYGIIYYVLFQNIRNKNYENYKWYGVEIPVAAVSISLIMYLVNRGMWVLAIAAVISAGLIFLVKQEESLNIRLMIAWFLMGAGAVLTLRKCADNLLAVLVIVLCGIICSVALNWPHPAGIKTGKRMKMIGVNVAVVLLLLIPCFRQGVSIKVENTAELGKVNITVEARGKDNEIQQAYYYWRDGKGQKVSENQSLTAGQQNLSMENECLTIVTVDKNGIETQRKVWFPYAFYNLQNQ